MLKYRTLILLMAVMLLITMAGWLRDAWNALVPISVLVASLSILAYGSFTPRAGFFITHRVHGRPGTLALTYDDGPSAMHTPALLDLLNADRVQATFFCIGRQVEQEPDLARRIVAEGHSIAVHTQNHAWWWGFMGRRRALAEIEECRAAIQSITGQAPKLFRPPFGVTSPATAWAIRRSGLEPVAWDLRTFDTVSAPTNRTEQRVLRAISRSTIVVMHDHSDSVLALTRTIIGHARKKGIELVKLSSVHLFAVLFGFYAFAVRAQSPDIPLPPDDPAVLELMDRSLGTRTLFATFEQEKHLKLLVSPVVVQGTFRFEQPGRLRWQVDVPSSFVAVVDGRRVRISENGKERAVSAADQQVFTAINDLIQGIVSGKMMGSADMQPRFARSSEGIVVTLTPRDARVAKRLREMRLVFDPKEYLLRELRMELPNGDLTITRFNDPQRDVAHPISAFTLP